MFGIDLAGRDRQLLTTCTGSWLRDHITGLLHVPDTRLHRAIYPPPQRKEPRP